MFNPVKIRRSFASPARNGFTLTELMIAAFLTLIVVSIGGGGVAALISMSKTNESQNERRGELNRSLDFITSEIHQSTNINTVTTDPSEFSPPTGEIDGSTVQTVLRLSVQGLSAPILYYVASPIASNLTWRGPKVIYRWGPDFDNSGGYVNPADPGRWVNKPLMDALSDTTASVSCPGSDWTVSPATSPAGFYACIDSTNKIARLFNEGLVSKALGQKETYRTNAQAFSRSALVSLLPSGLQFDVNNGEVVFNHSGSLAMQVLGSAFQCGDEGIPMKTQLVINKVFGRTSTASQPIVIDPAASLPTIPAYNNEPTGTRFNFTGSVPPFSDNRNNTCNAENISGIGFNSVAHRGQVVILVDGQTVPTLTGFAGSKSAKGYIQNYLDSSRTKVSLPDPLHQCIILFELGTYDSTVAIFDLQDIVLLATVTPN